MYSPGAPPKYSTAMEKSPGCAADGEKPAGLLAVDFLPQMTAPDGPSDRPEYEPFHIVMERANAFLREHPDDIVNTCESIELRMVQKDSVWAIDTVSSVFTAYEASNTRWIRALRLWTQRGASSDKPQQIGYSNFTPQVKDGNIAETLEEIVARINRTPIYGKIITVETQPVKWGSQGGINPDRTIWTESQTTNPRMVNLLRIFYIQGLTQHAQVCLADFVPKELPQEPDDCYRRFEMFPIVLDRVRRWLLSVPPNYRPVNVQSVLARWEDADKPPMHPRYIDTQKVMFHDFDQRAQFLRYLRVAYIIESSLDGPVSRSTVQLGSKLIMPLMTRAPDTYQENGEFETQDSARARLDRWVQSTGARVLSVEAVPMRIQEGGESVYGFDAMHTWNKTQTGPGKSSSTKRGDEKFVYCYRVYTDGVVTDDSQDDKQLLNYTLGTRENKQKPSASASSNDDCCIL